MSLDSAPAAAVAMDAAPMPALPPALAVAPGPVAALASGDEDARDLPPGEARRMMQTAPIIVAHAALSARRLGLAAPARSRDVHDALELFAFVRPAKFCAPSAVGLARALGLPEPKGAVGQARTLRAACETLLDE